MRESRHDEWSGKSPDPDGVYLSGVGASISCHGEMVKR